jgi:Mg2+ and Co2+ transporter CorA
VDVRVLGPEGIKLCGVDDIPGLLGRPDTIVWVDVPTMDEPATRLLSDVFGFHPRAIEDCARRNPVPKVHIYPRAVFVVLHAPEPGRGGHIHYVELDQFIGPGVLVTVHGPLNPAVDIQAALAETNAVVRRLESGRLRPTSSFELSSAIVSMIAARMRDYMGARTADVWRLEQQVTGGGVGVEAEEFLDELFRVRHSLLAVRNISVLSREVYGRMVTLRAFGEDGQTLLSDHVDQFQRIGIIAEGQKDYLQGVIEFFQTRTNTKMTIAAERLAVIAAVTLPITALSSIMGMNVIVNDRSDPVFIAVLLLVMATMSTLLLVWSKRQGWW